MAKVLTAKILPPPLPPAYVPRPQLDEVLAGSGSRRLSSVVAGAGFGKSTALAAWVPSVRSAWYTLDASDSPPRVLARGLWDALRIRLPGLGSELVRAMDATAGPDADDPSRAEALASLLAEALDREVIGDLVLVLDDVQELAAGSPSIALIEALVRQGPLGLHVVLSSRAPPPFPVARLRGRGNLLELDASVLAFGAEEVAAMLVAAVGPEVAELAPSVLEITEGWPAAVRLAAEALGRADPEHRAEAIRSFRRPGGTLYAYLAEEVFAREPPAVAELVRQAAVLERFTPELCEALGVHEARSTIAELSHRGLFLEPREEGWYSVGPLIRAFAEEHLPLEEDDRRAIYRRAARWLEDHGHVEEALRCLVASGDHRATARTLTVHGPRVLASGAVEAVVEAAASIPAEARTQEIDQLEGEALQIRGDWDGALVRFGRAAADDDPLPAGLAWRMGLIHYLRGNLDEAMATYERGKLGEGVLQDDALVLAWRATAHWLRGERQACRELGTSALELATASGDPGALAAAHTALALLAALEGDRRANDAHYLRALDAAERAGDVLQIIRIRVNRASHFIEEAAYEEALRELDVSIPLAELTGFAAFLALGLNNRGQARWRLGRLDEALADFEASRAVYQRIGSRMVCYSLCGAGDVYRERGDLALARAAYEESVAQADEAGDLQGLVPALAGLARVLVGEELEEARGHADRAVGLGPGMGYVTALLTSGWVALAEENRQRAAATVELAAAAARERRDWSALAEALVLRALAEGSDEEGSPAGSDQNRIAHLEEAVSIWQRIGDPIGAAKAERLLGRLSTGRDGRVRAARAEQRLRDLGVRVGVVHAAGPLAALDRDHAELVRVQSLGAFRVLRKGVAVPLTEWQSKKARVLLKVLVARRARPLTRDALIEILWPEEEESEKMANRLSVALTTVRAVLDPERRFPPDHFVTGDADSVALAPGRIAVDVEDFLEDAAVGLRALREGREEAAALLATAEATYSGDFLEENAYDDWAVPLREEARASYIAVAVALARTAGERGDPDAAVRYFLRVIERDPYDEGAFLGLIGVMIAAGRHGEARRHYRVYRSRMQEIGVEPAPFPPPRPAP